MGHVRGTFQGSLWDSDTKIRGVGGLVRKFKTGTVLVLSRIGIDRGLAISVWLGSISHLSPNAITRPVLLFLLEFR